MPHPTPTTLLIRLRTHFQSWRRHRWWSFMLWSTLIQGLLVVMLAYAWRTQELNDAQLGLPVSLHAPNPAPDPTPLTQVTPPTAQPSSHASPRTPTQAEHSSAPSSTQATKAKAIHPHAYDGTQSANTNPTHQPTASSTDAPQSIQKSPQPTPTPPNQSITPLRSVPINTQSLTYHTTIQQADTKLKLPDTRLTQRMTSPQNYQISLNNRTEIQGEGNFGLSTEFTLNNAGPQPTHIYGGAYLKTPTHPKGFSLGFLKMDIDTNQALWTWGHSPNVHTPATHTHFLDRLSLIAYLQGMLTNQQLHLKQLPLTLTLPIATRGAVRPMAIHIQRAPSDAPCPACIHARIPNDLGEFKQLDIWYHPQAPHRPTHIQALMGRNLEWQLTMALKAN